MRDFDEGMLGEQLKDRKASRLRRWILNNANNGNVHGKVDLSESPLDLKLSWRETTDSQVHLVGVFRLDLSELLRHGYIRRDPIGPNESILRLRVVREIDGRFFIQQKKGDPRYLLAPSDEGTVAERQDLLYDQS